jgi:hypothetical protein
MGQSAGHVAVVIAAQLASRRGLVIQARHKLRLHPGLSAWLGPTLPGPSH